MSLQRLAGLIASRLVEPSLPLHSRVLGGQLHLTRSFWSTSNGKQENGTSSAEGDANASGATKENASQDKENATNESAEGAETKGAEAPELTEREAQLLEQNKHLKERLLYAHAEMENTRRRAQLDVENERTYGVGKFGKALLDVADSLALALKHSPTTPSQQDGSTAAHEQLQLLHEGVVLTEKQLHKVLNQHGIRRFDSVRTKFDPAFHSALFEIPASATANLPGGPYEPGTVVEVLKEGFTIGERVLRPAEVGVVRKN
eukprot:TRINITY_DN8749_c0_g1_i1.p1 TRINITY_DN8749_c0_g1~~TRINITY_DN8749_c0_g1_i1.p1  ORF type:complete len:261 (+),score=66.97 TRINITY_DN8749_c0_g1_i1:83-865(+)